MPTFVPTPRAAIYNKNSSGSSDSVFSNNVYKFMGASILSVNMSIGYNGTPSSLSLTLVEDTDNGDNFVEPATPSLWGFSLPKGGVGAEMLPTNPQLQPNAFNPTNVKFYFCGICTSWRKDIRNVSGRNIEVTLVDAREMLKGVQCLLSGFSLSQNIGTGGPRYSQVDNVIDVFGYYNYGYESGKNEFGMTWDSIKQAVESVGVTVNDLKFEFHFTGDAFTAAPDWYRINATTIDIVSLAQRVCNDAGSDLVIIARKVAGSTAVVEFRAIRRTNGNPLSQTELDNFIAARSGIVSSANYGREYRNEPTSSIITGGFRNSNYVAYPSQYDPSLKLDPNGIILDYSFTDTRTDKEVSGQMRFLSNNEDGKNAFEIGIQGDTYTDTDSVVFNESTGNVEDYNRFPADIITRLFGGETKMLSDSSSGAPVTESVQEFEIDSGAIFPFWGYAPGGEENAASPQSAAPLVEPFLPLDHLVFDNTTDSLAKIVEKMPLCEIEVLKYSVRNVAHADVFLDGDGDPDERPFSRIKRDNNGDIEYVFSASPIQGKIRGLPLNTEVLRAAIKSEMAFYHLYSLFYPEIAEKLQFPRPRWEALETFADIENFPDMRVLKIDHFLFVDPTLTINEQEMQAVSDSNEGLIGKKAAKIQEAIELGTKNIVIDKFRQLIYQAVKRYAEDNMGRKFLVCLPKSEIMNRIWNGDPVPTNIEKPEIEYVVTDRGYWENLPPEFDGISGGSGFSTDQEKQIRRRFEAEDGRFYPMVVIDWKPTGNINFNSNGINKAMFQDLPVSEFRPNKIADGNPEFVFSACSVSQLVRRPDLALVQTPAAIRFDPTNGEHSFGDAAPPHNQDDEFLSTKSSIMKFLWYHVKRSDKARAVFRKTYLKLKTSGDAQIARSAGSFTHYCSETLRNWAEKLYQLLDSFHELDLNFELVMDFRAIVIPLTSTWVGYGPWYYTSDNATGMVRVERDDSLVPWNFERPSTGNWDDNLNTAGLERLARSLAVVDYLDSGSVSAAGFPEYGPADSIGYNSNITTISVNFGIGGVQTTYGFSTYAARPGTFRKSDYDDISQNRIDTRPKLPEPQNLNLLYGVDYALGLNQFTE